MIDPDRYFPLKPPIPAATMAVAAVSVAVVAERLLGGCILYRVHWPAALSVIPPENLGRQRALVTSKYCQEFAEQVYDLCTLGETDPYQEGKVSSGDGGVSDEGVVVGLRSGPQ
jgi:hypothetical protein